uniref:Uncharacterized protein n=1 Tax=Timema cristinae TaxID=61476 RepID=A0A7R9D6Q1_TIMCR|nr:unnamed protein product [Timema cristinae]
MVKGATLAVDLTAEDGSPAHCKMNFTTPAIMVRTMDPCMDMGDGQPMDPEACALKGNTSNTCTCTNMSMGMDMDMDMSMNMELVSEPAFAWRESGKPFRKNHPSSPDQDSNLISPSSAVELNMASALANYATEKGNGHN